MTLQEKRTSMLAMVESWRASDKTQIEFAYEKGLSVSTFRYWVRKSRALSDDGQALAHSGFVRVAGEGLPLPEAGNEIRLRYPNGIWLSLPCGTPLSLLKSLIDF